MQYVQMLIDKAAEVCGGDKQLDSMLRQIKRRLGVFVLRTNRALAYG